MAALAFIDPQWLSPSIVGVVLGAILLLLGITGGDSVIKEVRIPKVDGVWRALSLIFGIVLFLFGAGIVGHISTQSSTGTGTATSKAPSDAAPSKASEAAPPPNSKISEPSPTQKPLEIHPSANATNSNSVAVPTPPASDALKFKLFGNDATTERSIVEPTKVLPMPRTEITVTDDLSSWQAWEIVDLKLGAYPVMRFSLSQKAPHKTVSFNVPVSTNLNYSITLIAKQTDDDGGKTFHQHGSGKINADKGQSFKVYGSAELGNAYLATSKH